MKQCPNCGSTTLTNFAKKCSRCHTLLDESCIVPPNEQFKVTWNAVSKSLNQTKQETDKKKDEEKERCAEMDKQGTVYCPKCHSTSLSIGQKGFGVGNAAAGAFLTGNLLGLAAGAIGSNKVRITCLKCGHKFYPGKK
jgi:hypothetical protein